MEDTWTWSPVHFLRLLFEVWQISTGFNIRKILVFVKGYFEALALYKCLVIFGLISSSKWLHKRNNYFFNPQNLSFAKNIRFRMSDLESANQDMTKLREKHNLFLPRYSLHARGFKVSKISTKFRINMSNCFWESACDGQENKETDRQADSKLI